MTPKALAEQALHHAQARRWSDAEPLLVRALQADPACTHALEVLAFIRVQQHRLPEAAASYARILALAPAHRPARFNLARALFDLERFDDAARQAAALVAGNSTDAAAIELLARIRSRQNRFADAIALHDRAAAISGADPTADIARNAFAMQHACDWRQRAALRGRITARLHGPNPPLLHPFMLLADEAATPADILAANRTIAASYGSHAAHHATSPDPAARLRIGYLSGDFGKHALVVLAAELFELHDRDAIHVFGYAYGPPDTDGVRDRLARAMDFADLTSLSDEAAARRIAADRIDILVDLTGYGDAGRPGILARRPAPIQVNYLGYPATMGASWIDYLIADAIVTPASAQADYTERLIQLPVCYQPRDRTLPRPTTKPTRADCNLPEDAVVFSCFCNSYKITPDVFAIWMRLLHAIPGSVLWLLKTNPLALANLQRAAASAGIAPTRLIEADIVSHADHLARQSLADVFLDTAPYGAHTTVSDALWAGTPVVTCLGARFSSRVAASLLHHAGLPELVAATLQDYEIIALAIARNPAAIRARIASSALFDTPALARALEAAYGEMRKRFFFEKKNQETFGSSPAPTAHM